MNWKKALYSLEQHKEWDMAIALMEQVLQENPDDMYAYIALIYMFLDFLLEDQEYNGTNYAYYSSLATKYFYESYAKFENHPEYLFFVGWITGLAEWIYGINDTEFCHQMSYKASKMEPNNLLYQWANLDRFSPDEAMTFAKNILSNKSAIKKTLLEKGMLGEYIWDIVLHHCQEILTALKNWQKKLQKFENNNQWEKAFAYLKTILIYCRESSNLYAHLYYLLMKLLIKNNYKDNFFSTVDDITYFCDKSFTRSSPHYAYSFFAILTAYMSTYIFEDHLFCNRSESKEEYHQLLETIVTNKSPNLLCEWAKQNDEAKKEADTFAFVILDPESPLERLLLEHGTSGKKIFAILTHWSKECFKN